MVPFRDGVFSLKAQTVRVEELLTAAAADQLVLCLPPLPAQTDLHPATGELEEAGLAVPAGPGGEGVGDADTVVVEPATTRSVTANHVVLGVGDTTSAPSLSSIPASTSTSIMMTEIVNLQTLHLTTSPFLLPPPRSST